MNKIFILLLITLSVVFACHSSCYCDKGSNICKSCKFAAIGSKVDANKRYCACPTGYYSEKYQKPDDRIVCEYKVVNGNISYHSSQLPKEIGQMIDYCDSHYECGGYFQFPGVEGWYVIDSVEPQNTLLDFDYYQKGHCNYPVLDHNPHVDPKVPDSNPDTDPIPVPDPDPSPHPDPDPDPEDPDPHGLNHPSPILIFECHQLINTHLGNDVSVEMEACKLEIGLKTKDMKVLTDCHFENNDGKSYVVSEVRLDVTNSVFNPVCLNSIRTKLQYKSPTNSQYIDLPSNQVIENPSGNKTIKIPLINIFDMATSQNTDENQIVQVVNLKLFIGHEDNYVRSHKWNLIVYTNRDQVEVFQIDIDIQETEGCQPGQECIIIADLDTVSRVYTDSTFNVIHNPPHQYNVGDIFYAKIKFADPTYKKQLTFMKLYFKTDQNKIFNFSSITIASWDGEGLRISLPLVQPSQGAVIQVNMKISTSNARFLVGNEEEQTVQSKFQVTITDNQISQSANQNLDNNGKSNGNILFGMTFLSLLFLLF